MDQTGLFVRYWGKETILRAFCSSALWQIYQTLYLLFRVQKCRLTTPQDAGIIVLSMGGWDTHLPALGLQTQQAEAQFFLNPRSY
jgi:hypothetical protein